MIYSTPFEKKIKASLFLNRVLWFAFTSSILIYVIIAYIIMLNPKYSEPKSVGTSLEYILYGLGLVIAASSLIIKTIFLSNKKIATQLEKKVNIEDLAFDSETKEINQDALERLSELSETELRLFNLASWYTKPFFFQMICNEVVAILGLFFVFISHQPSVIWPFVIVSILLCLTSYNNLNRTVEKGKKLLRNTVM